LVLATQNPVEQEGVYRLPEAQLDRFLIRIQMGYPDHAGELALLRLFSRPGSVGKPANGSALDGHAGAIGEPQQVLTAEEVLDLQWQVAGVHGDESLLEYIVQLAEASRQHPDIALGASPRASLCLLRCARARALLDGRDYFTHEDVQAVAPGVLGHRLIVRPEAQVEGKEALDIVRELLARVPVLKR
jgi:MoxR-like ATPase